MSNRVRWGIGSGLLIFLGITANKWTPLLLRFVTDNAEVISGLANLSTVILFVCGAIGLFFGFRHPSTASPSPQKLEQSQSPTNTQQPTQAFSNQPRLSATPVQQSPLRSAHRSTIGQASGMRSNSLSAEHVKLIINLLEESGRVNSTDQRIALLQEIDLNPNQFKTHELNPHEFSVQLINSLRKRYPVKVLDNLIQAISEYLPGRATEINLIRSLFNK